MKNINRPWLDEKGVLLSTETLKKVSKSWDQEKWKKYLQTFDHGIEGRLISPYKFKKKCDYLTESIWTLTSKPTHSQMREAIKHAIAELTAKQRIIIKKYYFEGKSETQIAKEIGKHRTTVNEIKITALSRIKEYLAKNPCNLPSMKGQDDSIKDVLNILEERFKEGFYSDDEYFRLWALAEAGKLKRENL